MKAAFGIGLAVVALLASASVLATGHDDNPSCEKTRLFRQHGVVLWTTSDSSPVIFYKAGFSVDADGAFQAYHPGGRLGLDSLNHAGHPGKWWALVTSNNKKTGRPIVQGKSDPAPGYYVSTTALYDPDNHNLRDPHRYVDAATVPYVVLHPRALRYAQLGDFAMVVNLRTGKTASALVADESAAKLRVGEGSIALANELGINSNPRNGGQNGDVAYIIFPGSGNGRPRGLEEITTKAEALFESWGGLDKLNGCFPAGRLEVGARIQSR